MARAQDAVAVRAVLPFLERTREVADLWPRVRLVVVAIGATQAPTRGRGRAVLIIASMEEGRGIEVLISSVIGKDRDAALVMNPVGVGNEVIGRVSQLHLSGQHGYGQGGAMLDEVGAGDVLIQLMS